MYNDLPAGQIGLAQMWSGDIINAQSYLPEGTGPEILRYWFPADGKGMVDNDMLVMLAAARTRCWRTCSSTTCSTPRSPCRTSPPSATSRRRTPSPRIRLWQRSSSRRTCASAIVKPEYFDTGYRLLELDAANDAAWHNVWRAFNAGGS